MAPSENYTKSPPLISGPFQHLSNHIFSGLCSFSGRSWLSNRVAQPSDVAGRFPATLGSPNRNFLSSRPCSRKSLAMFWHGEMLTAKGRLLSEWLKDCQSSDQTNLKNTNISKSYLYFSFIAFFFSQHLLSISKKALSSTKYLGFYESVSYQLQQPLQISLGDVPFRKHVRRDSPI